MNRSAACLSRARGLWRFAVLTCAVCCIASGHTARAGINVWTTDLPETGEGPSALAIDPHTPSTLYAVHDGVSRSTDSGASWSDTGLAEVSSLAIDPHTPSTLYAGSWDFGGVFRSTDSGGSWSNTGLTDANVTSLAIDPLTPSTLYAGRQYHYSEGGVFRSTDSGDSWSNTGLPDTTSVTSLAIDPITPSTLYAGGCDDDCGVFLSTDSGSSWSDTGLAEDVLALAIDPHTPSTLYAGSYAGVSRSTDSGGSWSNTGPPDTSVTSLAIDPITPSTLYAGSSSESGRVGVSKSTDSGSSWSDTGLAEDVLALAIDPITPSTLYAGTMGFGVFEIEQVQPSCVGDCAGTHTVAVNEIITLVNIALGTAQPAACSNGGLPLGGEVNIAVIIEAVNNALRGCG